MKRYFIFSPPSVKQPVNYEDLIVVHKSRGFLFFLLTLIGIYPIFKLAELKAYKYLTAFVLIHLALSYVMFFFNIDNPIPIILVNFFFAINIYEFSLYFLKNKGCEIKDIIFATSEKDAKAMFLCNLSTNN